ncbi:MAG: hypothetical protein ABSG53_20735 [Thermoguttaceae bacterium]
MQTLIEWNLVWAWLASDGTASASLTVGGDEQHGMSVAESPPAVTKFKHRWFQYSLRTLLVLVTLCVIACSLIATFVRSVAVAQQEVRETCIAIRDMGGRAVPRGGFSLGCSIMAVYFRGVRVTDTDLEQLKGLKRLSQLHELCLEGTQITDAGLENLKGFTQLQDLELEDTKITDAGLEHLKGCRQLEYLSLTGTPIADAGLVRLEAMSQLKRLWLEGTKVTDVGLKKLHQALPNCEIVR